MTTIKNVVKLKTLQLLPDTLRLSGLGCGVAAAWTLSLPLGLFALGAVLLFVGWLIA